MPVTYHRKHVKLFFKVLDQKNCHYLPGDTKGGGIMKNVTNDDIAGGAGGLKFGIFTVMSFLNGP